jgi:hypothetical protein
MILPFQWTVFGFVRGVSLPHAKGNGPPWDSFPRFLLFLFKMPRQIVEASKQSTGNPSRQWQLGFPVVERR